MVLTFKVGDDKVDAWVIHEGRPMPQPGNTLKLRKQIYRVANIHWGNQMDVIAYLDHVGEAS